MRLARQAQTAVGLGGLTAGAGLCACLQTSTRDRPSLPAAADLRASRGRLLLRERPCSRRAHEWPRRQQPVAEHRGRTSCDLLPLGRRVMTLDGARRLLQAHSMLVPMSRPACTLAVLRVKAHLQATRFPCRGPPPPCHSQVTLVPSELHGWVRRS